VRWYTQICLPVAPQPASLPPTSAWQPAHASCWPAARQQWLLRQAAGDEEPPPLEEDTPWEEDTTDAATDSMMMDDEDADAAAHAAAYERMKQSRSQEAQDAQFPDEVDTPVDVAARIRYGWPGGAGEGEGACGCALHLLPPSFPLAYCCACLRPPASG
jgi:hypothetical protein